MADFITLQTRVLARLIDAPPSVQADVPLYVNQAIRDVEDVFNFSVMRAQTTFTTAQNTRTLGTMPTNYKEFRGRPYWLDATGNRKWMNIYTSLQEAYKVYAPQELVMGSGFTSVGSPRLLATQDFAAADTGLVNSLSVFPLPDHNGPQTLNYTVYVPYWRYLTDLSANGDTNWFTTYGELYILYQATAHGFMADWAEDRASAEFSLALGYRKGLIRRAANQSIAPINNLGAHSDVHQDREAWRRS